MRKPVTDEIIYNGPLTGTIDEEGAEGAASFEAIQQIWRVHSANEIEHNESPGYQEA